MRLKKIGAVLSLLASLTLIVHVGYSTFTYLTFYYDQKLMLLTAVPFLAFTCLHAVFGMCSVFLLNDGTRLDIYRKQNRGTVIQRVSAALIFPLLIIHLQKLNYLQSFAESGKWVLFGITIFIQTAFFAVVFTHAAASFTKALITLGLLGDRKKKVLLDRIVIVVCAIVFVVSSFAVIRGELLMFLLERG